MQEIIKDDVRESGAVMEGTCKPNNEDTHDGRVTQRYEKRTRKGNTQTKIYQDTGEAMTA